ncbi:MAG: DNA-directed RNA polymerase subunit beta' [Erythrobacter sp.]
MHQSRRSASSPSPAHATVARLAQPPRASDLHPIAARFVYSLRLIALHESARRDPVPELALRLGSVDVAAKALALAQVVQECWPESIHVSRFCCCLLSHDEATIGALVGSAAMGDRTGLENAIHGLVRPDRVPRLWDAAFALVAAEARAL